MNRFFSLLFFSCCLIIVNSCTKEVSRESFTSIPAQGSLLDANDNCLPDSVYGTYYTGVTPGSDTAYVQIEVNVTQTGAYSIITQPLNGLTFFDSGYFTTTGINTIHLKPIGTPIIITTSSFDFTFDSTTCSFSVSVLDSTGTGLGNPPDTTGTGGVDTSTNIGDNSWKFTAEGQTFSGPLATTIYGPATIGTQLIATGTMPSGSFDTSFTVSVQFNGNTLDTGYYQTITAGTNFQFTKLNGDVIYNANAIFPDQVVTIHIISYDSSTKVVKGTFSGTAYDFNGNNVNITNGVFKGTLQ